MNRSISPSWLALVLILAGCPRRPDVVEVRKPFEGQHIEIVAPAGLGFAETWELPLTEWSAGTGATARLVEVPIDGPESPLSPQYRRTADTGPGLLLCPLDRAGEVPVAEIPSALLDESRLSWLDLFSGLRDTAGMHGGRPGWVPLSAPVLVCYYRADLLRSAGRQPPATWEEYQALLDDLPKWAPGLTAVEPWGPEFRATMFLARAVAFAKHPGNYSLFFDIESARPLIASAGFVRALQLTGRALARMPREVLSQGPAECHREFVEGRAALAIAVETGPGGRLPPFVPGRASQPAKSLERTEKTTLPGWAACRLPGARQAYNQGSQNWEAPREREINHATLISFAGLAAGVSAHASPSQQEAAWNALRHLAGDDFAHGLPPGVASLCRESQRGEPANWVGPESGAEGGFQYVDAVALSLRERNVVAELPVPRREAFRQALAAGLESVLVSAVANETKTPIDESQAAAALSAVQGAWQQLVDEIGTGVLRDAYRVRLGLRPRGN